MSRPWRVIPGGDGGVIVYTEHRTWATEAVADWTRHVGSNVRPDLTPREDTDWLKWVLDRREAQSLGRDLMGRQQQILRGELGLRFGENVIRAASFGVHKGGVEGLGGATPALPTIYFMWSPGCPACSAMKPVLREFYQRNKDRIRVVPVDLSRVEWRAKAWEPNVTPTLIMRHPDGTLSKPMEGYEDSPRESFKKWLYESLKRPRSAP